MMRSPLISMFVVAYLTLGGLQEVVAQQRQNRPVTITYRSSSVIRTQWLPDARNPGATLPGESASTPNPGATKSDSNPIVAENSSPKSPQVAANVSNRFTPGFSPATMSNESLRDDVRRPTLQQMQNSSGGFQLSHVGMSQQTFVAPTHDFGSEHQMWSNLQTRSGDLDSFEAFNRSRPDAWGSYYSPYTYIGSANSQWSNLIMAAPTPSDLGGWSFGP